MRLPLDWVAIRELRTNLMGRRRRGQHRVPRAQLWVLELEPRLQPSGTLIFSDNFDQAIGSQPNPATWAPQNATDPNNPNVIYTNSTSTLSVVADPTAVGGKALAMTLMPDPNNPGKYDSSEIGSSIDPVAGQLLYGQIDASIKLPGGPNGQGDGIWPAFWMLGNNIKQVGWPTCGEMDIMENKGSTPGEIQGTIHGPGYQNAGITTRYDLPSGQAFYSSYHLFAVNWAPNLVQFSVDGNVYATLTPASLPQGGVWEFNHPFYIMLDVCDGGPFAGPPDGNSTFPQTMYVNYVQAYSYVAPPTVTAVSPAIGAATGGTSVTITGTGFTNATQVDFGGTNSAASFVVNSDTQITAVSPAGSPGNVDITVTTPGGTSATSSSDQFTFDDSTTTSVISSVNPSVFGQGVTFTATVSPLVGSNTPGGTVTFMDGSNTLGTATLSGGTATYTTSALAVGSHSITAVYSGDASDAGSTSPSLSQVVNQAYVGVNLSPYGASSVYGDAVTFTATVLAQTPGAGVPTGTVTFYDNATELGTGSLDNTGVATFTTSTLATGTHYIIASYGGDSNFIGYETSGDPFTVNYATTTTLSQAVTGVFGQTVGWIATVSNNAPGSGFPLTGYVTFFDEGIALGRVQLNMPDGGAGFSTSSLSVGAHTITASYGGDDAYSELPSPLSAPQTQIINPTQTLIALRTFTAPVFGQTVTLTAALAARLPGTGTPNSGTVTFFDGSTELGTGTVSNGMATYTTSSLAVGVHQLSAAYGGDDVDFLPATSHPHTEGVTKDSSTTAISSSANPSVNGQTVTITATVTANSPGSGTPAGTVTFKLNGVAQPVVKLNAQGQALFVFSPMLGTYKVIATYNGGADFTFSNSSNLQQVVNKDGTTTSLASSANPSVNGQTVTITATVSANSPGSGIPPGKVTFKVNGTAQPAVKLNAQGQATFTFSPTVGTYTVTASYSGGVDFTISAAQPLSQVVNKDAALVALVSSLNPSTFGQMITFTATVSAAAPGSGVPTGTVEFLDGTTVLGFRTLTAGQSTFRTSTLSAGSHSITVKYEGDSDFDIQTSAGLTETVNAANAAVTGRLPRRPGRN